MGEIGKKCFPPFLPKTKYTPWWSPKLNAPRKQVNALKSRAKRYKNSDLKEISNTRFKHFKNLYKSELLKAKRLLEEILYGEHQNYAFENVQNLHSWLCKATSTSSLTFPDGSVTTSERETANALHKFFPDDSTAQDSE